MFYRKNNKEFCIVLIKMYKFMPLKFSGYFVQLISKFLPVQFQIEGTEVGRRGQKGSEGDIKGQKRSK